MKRYKYKWMYTACAIGYFLLAAYEVYLSLIDKNPLESPYGYVFALFLFFMGGKEIFDLRKENEGK